MARRLIALFAILLQSSVALAQPDAGPDVEIADVEELEPIARAQVSRRIEETFRDMQERAPMVRRSAQYVRIRDAAPAFREQVARLRGDPALERLDTLHPASLHDLEQEWVRVHERLTTWQNQLEARSASLAEEFAHIVSRRRLWALTLDAERERPLSADERVRIDTLLEDIRRVKHRIDHRQEEVIALMGELSDEGLVIARNLAQIRQAQRRARERRGERDHHPLWEGWSRREAVPASPSFGEVAAEHGASMSTFVSLSRNGLAWHVMILLVLVAGFVALRRRSRSSFEPRPRASAHRALRARPFESALLVALVAAPIVYPFIPAVAVGAILVVLAPAVIRLMPYLMPRARQPIVMLLGLSIVIVPVNLGFVPGVIARVVVVGVQIAAIGMTGWLWWRRWAPTIAQANPDRRRLYRLVQIAIVPFGLALYWNLAGFTERAALTTSGVLAAISQGIGLFFATELIAALIREGLRTPTARRVSFTVQRRRRRLSRITVRLVRWLAMIAFVMMALGNFDVLDPTVEALTDFLQHSYQFGEIELTVGDVLAFVGMLLGTVAVMRFVHALLEFELLPRFELEQGIASAISLSVSYVLVAIGVVLAFGAAGVGPERLALLGGALGVGIGFGLQDVVSNFVSGLILVAERPIKVGDVIEVGELVGWVRRIGIRSSTVESLDGAEVIVPNSDLISDQLVNWTHSDARRRLNLEVGAAYAHDPAQVAQILLRVVRSQPGVLNDPPPDVLCEGFGDSSIEFVIRAWTPGYLDAILIKSRLAVRVYEALAAEGVEIPFPQRDLHLRSLSEDAAKLLRDEAE